MGFLEGEDLEGLIEALTGDDLMGDDLMGEDLMGELDLRGELLLAGEEFLMGEAGLGEGEAGLMNSAHSE